MALDEAVAAAEPQPAVLARIALVSDTHATTGTNRALYAERLERVISGVNAAGVDLVLIAGDLTEDGTEPERQALKKQIRRFKARTYYVPGNHDVGNKLLKAEAKADSVNSWRVRRYERSLGRSFYVRTHAGVRVLAINSVLFGSGLSQEKKLWEFMEKELAESSDEPVIVLSHYPPFVERPDEAAAYWNIEPEPRQRLLSLLQGSGVKIFLSGHLHREIVNRQEGLLLVTSIPTAFGLQPKKPAVGWTLLTLPVEGEPAVEFMRLPD